MRNYCLFLGLCVWGLSACQKNYESVPLGQQATINDVFNTQDSSGQQAILYLSNCYLVTLPNGHNRVGGDYLDAASDDAVSSSLTVSDVQMIATGAYTAASPNADDEWSRNYNAIRDCNVFINNIYRVPLILLLPDGRKAIGALRSEARFLRAWLYYQLIERYGGVPLVGDTVFSITDNVQLPRNSFADCVNYIVSECDNIKDSLRTPQELDANNYGRITSGMAMALKAQVLLTAASPLFNGGNIDGADPLTGYPSYDATRWQTAAQAAQDVMNLGFYSLVPSFENVFTTQAYPIGTNTETIFWVQIGPTTAVETTNSPVGYGSAGGGGETSPSQGLVDAYPMNNGLAITDPASGYNPLDPYSNRDPRLNATIFYNGHLWLNRNVETFDGGLDKPGGTSAETKTGYYMRKFMGPFETVNSSPAEYSNTIHDFIYCRYAEILLDFAEATNEYSGPSAAVYNVLTSLRQRAGIAPGTNNLYGLTAGMDQDSMRAAIHNERRIEMAFEEHHFWDIRRWKTAAQAYNAAPLQGMDIQQTASGLVYNRINVLTTAFKDPQMYFYPIPYGEVVKNPQMKQNPNW
ncbi:RagB/SusD family nutrient uptake outer membrane protein [Dinghuibacter silviterrae]|uniref:Putative outer membrane starch-binding protein n=1 Tax=Dinghuibacter silviterrae TaxID=1539049 RepID=A0A4R8DGF1_9BACT|nr:RagB/SusD family nutrient uptake outer membrane protein [Dinghuibacter silviterrae]TDW96324.1 putative outer membrane starch-binding protein [Dinghuibacter silviterrae]